MLDITEETRRAFLSDNSHKELSIEFDGSEYTLENINYFNGTPNPAYAGGVTYEVSEGETITYPESLMFYPDGSSSLSYYMQDGLNDKYFKNFSHWYLSFKIRNRIPLAHGSADVTCHNFKIKLYYYVNGNQRNVIVDFSSENPIDIFNDYYLCKLHIEKLFDVSDSNNRIGMLEFIPELEFSNVVVDAGYNKISATMGYNISNVMFTLSDIAPENYIYPEFKASPIKNGVYPTILPKGVDSTDEINYFTGITKFFTTYSTANVPEDRTVDQWDMFYFYPEGSDSYTDNLHGAINEAKSHQYTNLYISIDAKYINHGIIHGNADVEYTGPLWLSVYYVENGVNKTRHIAFTDTTIINEFLSQNGTRLHAALYDFIDARFFDANNYIKNIRIYFRVKYSNVVISEGYDYITHYYDIVFDNLMINLSNTPSNSFEYPPYSRSQIINGVYPMLNIHNDKLMLESFQLTESICSKDNLKFGLSEAANCSFNVADTKDDYINQIFRAYITCDNTEKIPLGRFRITSVNKETKYNLVTKAITAYDEMIDWDKDATDWYADYMFGISSDNYNFGGFEFARQMFSTYYNFARFMSYENDDDYQDELIFDMDTSNLPTASRMYKYTSFKVKTTLTTPPSEILCTDRGDMQKFEINNVSSDYLYKFEKRNMNSFTDDEVFDNLSFLKKDHNPKKGILTKASVMVEEVLDDNTYNRFLVDAGDYFAVSDNCTKLNIYYAIHIKWEDAQATGTTTQIVWNVSVYRTPCPNWVKLLVNKSARLVYYDWETLEWSTPACSVRDVFRSLMEINGAFVKINRQGNVECVYSRKGSLYPSETLYPSEDLYPIKDAMLIPSAKYSVSQQEDYQSADFGKIQIKSQNNDKDAITLRTFVGNANYDSTYIIDDNVFFCNSAVKFNYRDNVNGQSVTPYDVLPEINTIMGRMFNRISSMGYTPHDTTLVGMPWVETGDRVTLVTYIDAFESFVFRRTMKGIQGLFDTYEAHGDNVIEAYKEVVNE